MDKAALKTFINKHPENYSIQLKRHYRELYNSIDKLYTFPKFGQKLYHYLHGDNIGKCEVCGDNCQFDSYHKGYRKRCSYKCLAKVVHNLGTEKRNCVICKKEFEIHKSRIKTTCSNKCLLILNKSPDVIKKRQMSLSNALFQKYGVYHSSKIIGHGDKLRKTKLLRYGDENYVNIEKAKQTKLKKYKNETFNNREKSKSTKLLRYGDENYNNRIKFINTNNSLYGVDYPIQKQNILQKAQSSLIEKYGGVGMSSPVIKKKIESTNIKKYGSSVATKNFDIINKVKRTHYDKMYDELINGDRLQNRVRPLFSKEEYIGSKKDYQFLCLKCNVNFLGTIEDGKIPRCPKCFPIKHNSSKYEDEVFQYLISECKLSCGDIQKNNRKLLSGHEVDIYIPDKKIAIEFDGIVWHSECFGNKHKNYHLKKTQSCEINGIQLIHIFENEWRFKKDIVKRKLLNLLGASGAPIYAKKCNIKIISPFIKNTFLKKYHIQGKDKSSISLGAYFMGDLVAVMTFGKLRVSLGNKTSKENEYEMYRFCIGEKRVVGIAGKLFSYFIKNFNPNKVITFADRRYSIISKAFYEKIGFEFIKYSTPNYWYFYFETPMEMYHRFSFRKDQLSKKLNDFDSNLTEWQNMQLNGYDRIWDCGNLKYEYTP